MLCAELKYLRARHTTSSVKCAFNAGRKVSSPVTRVGLFVVALSISDVIWDPLRKNVTHPLFAVVHTTFASWHVG